LSDSGTCPNWLCRRDDRKISRISAIAYLSGDLKRTIHDYKYNGKKGWGLIFGRLVLGWLNQHKGDFNMPDLIIANPTFTVDGSPGHTERVLEFAEKADVVGRWPFDIGAPRAVVKTGPTPQSAGATAEHKRMAAASLKPLLSVTDAARILSKRILIYDDVCTTGSQLNTIAEVLVEAGARSVSGLVLARAPWRHDL
jgi:predicted amidophosphoribosyltransferase